MGWDGKVWLITGEVEIKYDETVREIKGGLELCTDPVGKEGRLGGGFFGGGGDSE